MESIAAIGSSSNAHMFFRVLQRFNKYMERLFSIPKDIAEHTLDIIKIATTSNPFACGCCLCTAITATVCVTSIAVGVGVGVGIGCMQTEYAASNSTSS